MASLTLLSLHALIIASHSSTDIAIGFSHQTCFPVFAALIEYSACIEGGKTTYIISISGLFPISSRF